MERILSGRLTAAILFVVVMTARLLQIVFFYNPRVDASYQLMAAKNFLEGKGFTLDTVSAADLSLVTYTHLVNWPPGYSLLVAPFMLIFGNYMIAAIVLDSVMALSLLITSMQILKLLKVPLYLRNFGLLLMGFYIYFFYLIASSDAIAIPFFMASLLLVLQMITYEKTNVPRIILFSILLLIFASIKYLFMPVACLLPAIILWIGYRKKINSQIKAGSISLLIVATGIALILFYQKDTGGAAVYVSQPERGFFPSHLKEAYPFIPASFLKPESISTFFPSLDKIVFVLFQLVHLLAFGWFSFWLLKKIRNEKYVSQPSSFLYIITWVVSVCITLTLAFLSVRVAKEEILPGWFWTYIEEPRYYGLAIVLLQLCILVYLSGAAKNITRSKQALVFVLLISFLPEMGKGLVFTFNRLRKLHTEEYSWQYENRFQKYADSIFQQEKKPGEFAVVTGSSYYMNHRVNLFSGVPILNPENAINDTVPIRTSKPVLVLVILQEKELPSYQPFLNNTGKEEKGKFADLYFYTLHVNPQK